MSTLFLLILLGAILLGVGLAYLVYRAMQKGRHPDPEAEGGAYPTGSSPTDPA